MTACATAACNATAQNATVTARPRKRRLFMYMAGSSLAGDRLRSDIELDLLRVGGWREVEDLVVELRAQVPVHDHAVLGLAGLAGRRDDHLARQRSAALLDPDLPVDVFLPERVVVADEPFDVRGADPRGARDR